MLLDLARIRLGMLPIVAGVCLAYTFATALHKVLGGLLILFKTAKQSSDSSLAHHKSGKIDFSNVKIS